MNVKLQIVFSVVALGLAAVTAGAAWTAWQEYQRDTRVWREMQSWTATPARVTQAQLLGRTHHRRRGVYTIAATYRYEHAGRMLFSSQVESDDSVRVIGSAAYRPRLARQLSEARMSGRLTTCFVNPREPTQAVLLPVPPSTARAYRLAVLVMLIGISLAAGMAAVAGSQASQGWQRCSRGLASVCGGVGGFAVAYILYYQLVLVARAGTPGYPTVFQILFGCLLGSLPAMLGLAAVTYGLRLVRENAIVRRSHHPWWLRSARTE